MQPRRPLAILIISFPLLLGFDTSRSSIPVQEIFDGGPPKDGIPAILRPNFVSAADADFLGPHDRVVGYSRDGVAKAYPLRILNLHEIVNDSVGSRAIAVTYCPLTDTAIVYDRLVGDETLSFGVSGRLYQSNVLMYDHQSESLWSQLEEGAVTGPRTGTKLRALASVVATWQAWQREHPDTLVLATATGFRRDYSRDPYDWYHESPGTMFPVRRADDRLPAKSKVFGIEIGAESRAYPVDALRQQKDLVDTIGGTKVRISYDDKAASARATAVTTNQLLPAVTAYWFAWAAFHPETKVWKLDPPGAGSADGARP